MGNNVREVVRVVHHVTGFAYRKILKEINEYFGDRIAKRRSELTKRLRKSESTGKMKAREEKKRKLEESIIEINNAARKEMAASHKNKQLSKKWV